MITGACTQKQLEVQCVVIERLVRGAALEDWLAPLTPPIPLLG